MMHQINTITHWPGYPSGIVVTHGLRDSGDKTACGTTIKNYRSDDPRNWYVQRFIGGWMDRRSDHTDQVSCQRCRKYLGLGDIAID